MTFKPSLLPIFFLLAFLIQGCSTPYYGYTKQEWDNLSKDEKTAIKSDYQTVIDSKSVQEHADTINAIKDKIIKRGSNPGSRVY